MPDKKTRSKTTVKSTAKKTASKSIPTKKQKPSSSKVKKKKAAKKVKEPKKISKTKNVKSAKTKNQQASTNRSSFPVVGIGSSAGGLEAFEELLSGLPQETGMAFVLITHQSPDHISLLPELLKKYTGMNVQEVSDNMEVKKNFVYLSPPGKNVEIFNGHFQISNDRTPHRLTLPIDFFFRSLADDQKEKSIGIILSGMGTDGTLGLSAIKAENGLVIAQSEGSAKFTGMPGSVIATGLADHILPPSEIATELIKYSKSRFFSSLTFIDQKTDYELDKIMPKIFMLIRSRTGHDFSMYKSGTTMRRIKRRLNIHHMDNPLDYLKYISVNQNEIDVLFKELLIGVTSFFRDKSTFAFLYKNIIPKLVSSKKDGSELRVWIPACSTGEEVYSIAIMLSECIRKLGKQIEVKIFATDLDPQAIEQARAGIYPAGIKMDVTGQRLSAYFNNEGAFYRVRKSIREMVVFAPQNTIKDPPFTKLDLISCRNLMIYMGSQLQDRLLSIFHYSLKPGGYLFLGNSESLGVHTNLFKQVDKKQKIFSRLDVDSAFLKTPVDSSKEFAITYEKIRHPKQQVTTLTTKQDLASGIKSFVEQHLLVNYSPASVVVDEKGRIHYIHGKTGNFLEPAQGRPDLNIFNMAREDLRMDLATALRESCHQETAVVIENILVRNNDWEIRVDLTVQKITDLEKLQGLYLVVFAYNKSSVPVSENKETRAIIKKSESILIKNLKKNLQHTRENLQSTIEELETTNEELKSTNEELQSTNEELQSSNEEIETSKEEMESLNEELRSTNSELQSKVNDYATTSDDMKNLLNSTNIATLFLDNDLNIKRFTSETKSIINLISSDIGRPISDIVSKLQYPSFIKDCKNVLKKINSKDLEIQSSEKQWYRLRIQPYRTSENKIDGLVITFMDITEFKAI